ncbi:DUF1566 domain-containing protein [Methylomonas koyamae]|uniref:DUF1566 domain-containing protein n=1 Tax=Methylomonas koyamae TaxID=702114 RepID=UPI0007C97BBE|nr:DUF1566 domain-containing protein [Methylomonas koyamae]ATG91610.1 hypothetical protein MKLM6_3423 [Methylomonas koyamae]
MQPRNLCSIAVLAAFSVAPAQAELLSRLGGLAYYDTDAGITWLADADYAKTSGYDNDGLMTWDQANAWAAGLNIAGVTGWHLPYTQQPDASCGVQAFGASLGNNCEGSELGNLFYNVLGGSSTIAISDSHNDNYDLFSNIRISGYWSATEFSGDPLGQTAWTFGMGGVQIYVNKSSFEPHAWAVRDGDVAAVPVPAAIWLYGAGLGLLAYLRRYG